MQDSTTFSHWEQTTFFKTADVVIVGGGIVGTNAAIHLKESKPDWRIVLVERGILPSGASTKNAGFACFGSMTELLDDLQTTSEDKVFALVEKRWKGLQRLRQRVGDRDLQYKNLGAYELFKSEEATDFEACKDRLDDFNQKLAPIIGIPQVFQVQDEQAKPFGFQNVAHLIYNQAEGQLHPGEMMNRLWTLARSIGVEIYTGIEVQDIEINGEQNILRCKHGINLKTVKVLLTTNGFTKRLVPELEVQPARNQVLITKPVAKLPFKGCFHYDKGYFYFRNVGDRVLLGGGRNLAKVVEETDEFGHTKIIQQALLSLLNETLLPDIPFEVDRWWSGILGVGKQKQPIVKEIKENIFAAVRLGGMGVAIGTLVGEEAADLVLNA